MTGAPLVVLVNPGAREGRAAARLRSLLAAAPDLDARARVAAVSSVDEASRALAAAPPGALAVAAGGDGTVNLVARALRATDPGRALAIVPLGTGNAVAHSLGVGSAGAALAALAGGAERRVDVLATTSPAAPLALCSLSAGFEADLLRGLAGARGAFRSAGILASAGILTALPRAARRRRGIVLVLDGRVVVRASEPVFNAGVYNLPCYAFGRMVHPDAVPDDGRAEGVVHPGARSWLAALLRGQPTAGGSRGTARAGRFVRAALEVDGPIQVDGESAPGGAFEVEVERAALRIIVPANRAAPVPPGAS